MKTKIISAFPGMGKSYYHQKNKETTLDTDSSLFSYIIDENGNKIRNPEFPRNYINHIKENIGKYEFIFISTDKEIIDILLEECIFFYLICPTCNRKNEFLSRYKNRGDDEKLIQLIDSKWNDWIKEIEDLGSIYGVEIIMWEENLSDILIYLKN